MVPWRSSGTPTQLQIHLFCVLSWIWALHLIPPWLYYLCVGVYLGLSELLNPAPLSAAQESGLQGSQNSDSKHI